MKKVTILFLALLFITCSRSPIEKGTICLGLGDYTRAVEFFNSVIQNNPADPQARLGLGKATLQLAVDKRDSLQWRVALMNIEAAKTLSPSDTSISVLLSEAWTQFARIKLHDQDTITALESITHAIENNQRNIDAINLAGIIYFRGGDRDKSQALFTKAIQLDPASASGYFNLGIVKWSSDSIIAAHELWLNALKYAPHDEEITYWFAQADNRLRAFEPSVSSHRNKD